MKSAEEKLTGILTNLYMLPQIKNAYYDAIISNSVPLLIKVMEQRFGVSTEELLEYFYDMDMEDLQGLVDILVESSGAIKLSEETMSGIMGLINDEREDEEL